MWPRQPDHALAIFYLWEPLITPLPCFVLNIIDLASGSLQIIKIRVDFGPNRQKTIYRCFHGNQKNSNAQLFKKMKYVIRLIKTYILAYYMYKNLRYLHYKSVFCLKKTWPIWWLHSEFFRIGPVSTDSPVVRAVLLPYPTYKMYQMFTESSTTPTAYIYGKKS